jgi:hypothetical protein
MAAFDEDDVRQRLAGQARHQTVEGHGVGVAGDAAVTGQLEVQPQRQGARRHHQPGTVEQSRRVTRRREGFAERLR